MAVLCATPCGAGFDARDTGQFMYRRDSPSRMRSMFSFVDQQDDSAADDAGQEGLYLATRSACPWLTRR